MGTVTTAYLILNQAQGLLLASTPPHSRQGTHSAQFGWSLGMDILVTLFLKKEINIYDSLSTYTHSQAYHHPEGLEEL